MLSELWTKQACSDAAVTSRYWWSWTDRGSHSVELEPCPLAYND